MESIFSHFTGFFNSIKRTFIEKCFSIYCISIYLLPFTNHACIVKSKNCCLGLDKEDNFPFFLKHKMKKNVYVDLNHFAVHLKLKQQCKSTMLRKIKIKKL